MGLRVSAESFPSLQAYRAALTAGGLAQPDVVISFTGMENKIEGISDLRELEPAYVAWRLNTDSGPMEPRGEIERFPSEMPRPFVWNWSSADIKKQISSTPDARHIKAFRFNATGEFAHINTIPFHGGDYFIILSPSDTEAAHLGEHLKALNLHNRKKHAAIEYEDILAFAKVMPLSDMLVVRNMQTSLFSIRLPERFRSRYNYWQRQLMLSIEDYAFKAGFREVCIATANYQMRRWGAIEAGKGIHPSTAYRVYSLEPYKMGYSLVQTEPINLDWINVNLLWSKQRADFFRVPDKSSR